METIDKVISNLGAADIDARLEELLVDGILYAFQEQVCVWRGGLWDASCLHSPAAEAIINRCQQLVAAPLTQSLTDFFTHSHTFTLTLTLTHFFSLTPPPPHTHTLLRHTGW